MAKVYTLPGPWTRVRRGEGLPRPIPAGDLAQILQTADNLPLAPRTLFRLLADLSLRTGKPRPLRPDWTIFTKY